MLHADVRLAWKTQAGHRHRVEGLENEDAVFVTHEHPVFDALLMVADGMGGHPRPREASEAAVRTAREVLFDPAALERSKGAAGVLHSALVTANLAVGRLWNGRGMRPGTTLSIAAVADGTLYVAHVGDGSVYLMRDGQVRAVAGGEERRIGNRPAQYLGQETPLEVEERRVAVAAGDRVLLCTDGLTRYFQEAGPEALERVLGREGVEVQAIASQLTAHSRPADYDDDTTVALAEVTALNPPAKRPESAPPLPPESKPDRELTVPASRGIGAAIGPALTGLVVGLGVLAGFYAGRVTAPAASAGAGAEARVSIREAADPAALKALPPGNLILLDELGKRVYALPTRSGAVGTEPVDLQGFRVLPTGRLAAAGRFRLDPTRGTLTDAAGHVIPVDTQSVPGSLSIARGGTLEVHSRLPGARVSVNGRELGKAPQKLTVASGIYQVRVDANGRSFESQAPVPAGGSVSITLGAP